MSEVVQQRLHLGYARVHPVAIGNLAKKMNADGRFAVAEFVGYALPVGVPRLEQAPPQEVHDGFHEREGNPHPGCVSTHDWEMVVSTIPLMGDGARSHLAANLNRLMSESEDLRTIKQLSEKSGVSTGTIDRLRRAEVSAGVDHLDQLAKAFNLEPWELIRPDAAGGIPFRDLNVFEAQYITLFRTLDADKQHEVLIALNNEIKESAPSTASPFKSNRRVRGVSKFGELDELEVKKVK